MKRVLDGEKKKPRQWHVATRKKHNRNRAHTHVLTLLVHKAREKKTCMCSHTKAAA